MMSSSEALPTNLAELFVQRWRSSGRRPAFWDRQESGRYVDWSWDQLASRVLRLADALRQLEVQPGDRVVHLAENRTHWVLVDLALPLVQAVHVPIHASLAGPQILQQLVDCGARLAVISTAQQAQKLSACGARIPSGLRLVGMDPAIPDLTGHPVAWIEELMQQADEDRGRQWAEQAVQQLTPNSYATILYTSGTTGEPKGVVLTHANLVSNALGVCRAFGLGDDELRLTVLPLSHIFARTCDLYTWLATGHQLALAGSRETLLADAQQVRPTIMNCVPYFFEFIQRRLQEAGQHDRPGAVCELFGGRIRYFCSGGAALPEPLFDFFQRQGVPLLQGYGLTESSPVITLNLPHGNRRGSVGCPLRGVEVRIALDGEILTRGPHVMAGYWQNPAATAEVIRDGWLYTGDVGALDEEGYLYITGRKKELIVTAGGKNIAPVYLEGLLTQDPLIHQAVVIGDGRKYLVALIVPEAAPLRQEIMRRNIPVSSAQQALQHPEVIELYGQRIAARLGDLSPYEQIGRFALLDRALSVESGELTPKLSLRRDVIQRNFAQRIEELYAGRVG